MVPAESLTIELVWSPARGQVEHRVLCVPAGSTLLQAAALCADLVLAFPDLNRLEFGIWGRLQAHATVLRERDRIELFRPLTVDPMEARRQRYRAKGERIVSRHRPLGGKTTR